MDHNTYVYIQVGRAGRFGTKGLAVTFCSSSEDTDVLNKVQQRFEVSITELPATVEPQTYSKSKSFVSDHALLTSPLVLQ